MVMVVSSVVTAAEITRCEAHALPGQFLGRARKSPKWRVIIKVDALRQKLEGKNQQMEQRDRRIKRLEGEFVNIKGEFKSEE
ncbi:hypothetical protein KIN20_028625 [Parelaphostrongylus tenuis]|uniref:Uncharacterized protein n=1 Tax=Parelaphostrongylus tenuis TaxID=148309 RepID=A0AAD5R1J2_PARTN|nr:hypothetical protein KIN20_028625 [Parelaphostrongylus tenuis]